MQIEKEFSIRQIACYSLRLWIVLVLATVIGITSALAFYLGKNKDEVVVFSSEVHIILTYSDYLFFSGQDPSITAEADWKGKTAEIVGHVMGDNIAESVYKNNAIELYNKEANSQDFLVFNRLLLRERGRSDKGIRIAFAKSSDSAEAKQIAKKVVDDYLATAVAYIKNTVDIAKVPQPAPIADGDTTDPTDERMKKILWYIPAEESVNISSFEKIIKFAQPTPLILDLGLGLVTGIVIGLLVTVVLYFVDPRIKSANQLEFFTQKDNVNVIRSDEDKALLNVALFKKIRLITHDKKSIVIVSETPTLSSGLAEVIEGSGATVSLGKGDGSAEYNITSIEPGQILECAAIIAENDYTIVEINQSQCKTKEALELIERLTTITEVDEITLTNLGKSFVQ